MSRRSILFTLWTLQGLIALVWLALLPGDAGGGLLFGFSSSRLALLGSLLALTALSAVAAWHWRTSEFALRPVQHDITLLGCLLMLLVAPAAILVLRALGQTSGFTYAAYALRLAPLAAWITLSAVELFGLLSLGERHEIAASLKPLQPFYLYTFYSFLALTALALLMGLTRLGLTPSNDNGSWGTPSTPLLEWQILLALAASLIFLTLGARGGWLQRERWIPLLVYLSTVLLWLSQPINPGFFATPPRAPNFEIYPFSDALIYAQYAQSAMIGHGFMWPDVPARPLYIALLTWMHALAGQDYNHVIALQTLVLAAFPMMLYLLGKELGGRPLGIGLAILAAFRDLTANAAAPFALNYTYSKLFFSEIPAALLLSLFALMAIRWVRCGSDFPTQTVGLRSRADDGATKVATTRWYPLLAGGVLGLASLIRLQSAVILVAVIPFGFFLIRDRRRWAAGSGLMVLGTLLALAPWMARNYQATGGLVLDNPTSQAMTLAAHWSPNGDDPRFAYLPGEGEAHYTGRMMDIALQDLRQNPAGIPGSAVNHFFNNETGNLLVFPLRDRLNNPAELLWPQHAFWQTWAGRPDGGQMLLIAAYLALLGTGLAAAWFRNGPIGLLPLGISVAYNAWTALFLSSGDRFLVPVDWGVYLYHFLGLLTLAGLALGSLKAARENVAAWILDRYPQAAAGVGSGPVSWRGLALTGALILALGAAVPLTELAFSRVPIPAAQHPVPAAGQIVLSGRATYPRYYAAGQGEPGSAKNGYGKSDQARLVFFLVGEQNTLVILPLKDAPAFFPNAADVTVIATQENGFVNAVDVVVEKDGKKAEYMP